MNSNLQNKLQQFRAAPPEGVWDKIADALDNGSDFAERLYQYEEQPPAAAWPPIEASLDEQVTAKVVPLTKRIKRPMRYAAVASLLAVLLVTITLTVRRTRAGDLEAEAHSVTTAKKVASTPTEQVQDVYPSTKTSGSEEQPEAGKSVVSESTQRPDNSTAATVVTPVSKATPVSARYLLLNSDD
ncbi:MAG TPA: hypothetical protein VFL47_11205, partial [Flavisolibacter sp.]|nr:hypothetical protein [Flavisolibacter sp.]